MGKKASADEAPGVGERLIDTASELFYREGVRAVGIQRIIDEAGIAKASLYAHYESKDELVAACLAKQAAGIRTRLEERVFGRDLDARGKLLAFFDYGVEWAGSLEFRGCPFHNAIAEISDANHPARRISVEHRGWVRERLKTLAVQAGLTSPEAVADTLLVLFDGGAAGSQVDGNPEPARHARWAAEQIIDAHLPAKSRKSRRAPARSRVQR